MTDILTKEDMEEVREDIEEAGGPVTFYKFNSAAGCKGVLEAEPFAKTVGVAVPATGSGLGRTIDRSGPISSTMVELICAPAKDDARLEEAIYFEYANVRHKIMKCQVLAPFDKSYLFIFQGIA